MHVLGALGEHNDQRIQKDKTDRNHRYIEKQTGDGTIYFFNFHSSFPLSN